MVSIIVVSIVFGSLIALATLICGTVLVLLKTRSRPRGSDSEEARIFQEIYQGLERMEERIESLETILMADREKEGYKK